MRTTLTLDDDPAKQPRETSRRSCEKPSPPLPRFVVESKPCGFRAGVDILHLNRFFGEVETEDFLRQEAAQRSKR